ncbi:steroidogenic acute regulatory protein-like [Teleopsis dalmanni]|uniref:steroidogenic acute regulatory protein-like n=1 Tax=Teleopsis dalmanni TaxID=139649 RepID=UPI0018CCFF22|nr:steroidogenic acute regulatory protein-like [Teleopsis dalmanni]
MNQNEEEIRSAAEILINNSHPMSFHGGVGGTMPPPFDITRTHSNYFISEDILGGYMQDGRMSVVRRFFCLFVTFDLFFVSLLWLICIVINGNNIFQAFEKEILHYTIYKSLFDVVVASICRFIVLIFFYGLLYINHWIIIALSTSGSCLFLISKVFVFDWVESSQQVFEVILIITSFVLAWGEAWFLDCRVFPQERHARHYFSSSATTDRTPLMAPFLASQADNRPPESVANFYSPLDYTTHNSDDEEEDNEFHQMGLDCLRKVYELLESSEWKCEKVNKKGDTIKSTQRDKLGKIYRLTARIKYPPKALLEELFYKIEDVPKWNPTLLESKIIRKINSYTDITYQASVGGGAGLVKSRDFVNLRCWRFFRNGKISDDDDDKYSDDETLNRSFGGSVSTISDGDSTPHVGSVGSNREKFSMSNSDARLPVDCAGTNGAFQTLSKSLGAKDFNPIVSHINFDEPPPDEEYVDAKDNLDEESADKKTKPLNVADIKVSTDKAWISAAISVEYAKVPPTTKYIRGENLITGFVLREIEGKADACIFEWILCLNLKGYVPRYVLDTAYTTFMTDYMTHLRKYVNELRQKRKGVPKN